MRAINNYTADTKHIIYHKRALKKKRKNFTEEENYVDDNITHYKHFSFACLFNFRSLDALVCVCAYQRAIKFK